MALTAPRYSSTGASVSAMPTPQVSMQSGIKPDYSTADSLKAIGDTIASVSKTVGTVMDYRKNADETAGADMYLQWKARNDARVQEYKAGNLMGNALANKGKYEEMIAKDDGSDLLEGKSDGVRAAFARRMNARKIDYKSDIDTHATIENKRYTVFTADNEEQDAKKQAALNFALPDAESRTKARDNVDIAVNARIRRASVTGEIPTDRASVEKLRDRFTADAYMDALAIAAKQDPHLAAKVYAEGQQFFGPHAEQAAVVAQDSLDKVFVLDTATPAMAAYGPSNGKNFDPDEALAGIGTLLEGQSDQRKQMVYEQANRMAAADMAQRKKVGVAMKAEADAARRGGAGALAEYKAKFGAFAWRLTSEDRETISHKMDSGVEGLPQHEQSVDALMAAKTPASAKLLSESLARGDLVLGQAKEQQVREYLASFEDAETVRSAKAREEFYKMYGEKIAGQKVVMPGDINKPLDSAQKKLFDKATFYVDKAMGELDNAGKGKKDSPVEQQEAFKRALLSLQDADPILGFGRNKDRLLADMVSDAELEKEARLRLINSGRPYTQQAVTAMAEILRRERDAKYQALLNSGAGEAAANAWLDAARMPAFGTYMGQP